MRGLIKATQAAQTAEAWRDWHRIKAFAQSYGILRCEPPVTAGHKTVDRFIADVWASLQHAGAPTGPDLPAFLDQLRLAEQAQAAV